MKATWTRLQRTLKEAADRLYNRTGIDKWLIVAVIVISFFSANIYRLFPVAMNCVKCKTPYEPLIGDRIYYLAIALAWIGIIQALRTKANYWHDKILLSGFFSLCINELADEIFFSPYEVTTGEIIFNVVVALSVCLSLKLRWYYLLLVVGAVVGLGMI